MVQQSVKPYCGFSSFPSSTERWIVDFGKCPSLTSPWSSVFRQSRPAGLDIIREAGCVTGGICKCQETECV